MSLVSQTRVKVSERVALVGDKRLPLLPQWFFNIGLKYERESEREREKEREGRCLFKGGQGMFDFVFKPYF
jgi:hypothetical protein